MDKKFWATTFTLSGMIIGAGVLGLPFLFAKSGFLIGVLWIIIIGLGLTFVHLCLAEVTLRTRGKHQLPGYAKKYLGRPGSLLMSFSMFFGIYAALLAYLVGEGQSISALFGNTISPLTAGILFWFLMTLLLRGGLKRLKRVEMYGVLAIIIIIVWAAIYYTPSIQWNHLLYLDMKKFAIPFGAVLFSLMGFTAIPELRQEIAGSEKSFKKAIILGSLFPAIVYIIFAATVIGVRGTDISQVATLSLGPFMILLGIFTMMTSFFVLSFALRDFFKYDLGLSKPKRMFMTSILPLILYIVTIQFNLLSFAAILSISGLVSGGIAGILSVFMNLKAKKQTKTTPSLINMPLNLTLAIIISLIFVIGVVLQFLY